MSTNGIMSFALLALLAGPSSSARVDFSGTWVPELNAHQRTREPKTREAADAPVPAIGGPPILFLPPLRIVDNGSELIFESLNDAGGVLSTSRIRTDGKELSGPPSPGAPNRKSLTKREGRSVKTEWTQAGENIPTSTGTETWTLSSDNNTLTHATTSEDANWRNRTKTTYKRK